jgi:hypothetical protein
VYNSSQTVGGNVSCDNVTVQTGVTLTINGTVHFSFTDEFVIESGATVGGAGQGYAANAGPGAAGTTDDEGGAHGGDGGGSAGGSWYGSAIIPSDMGSGGSDHAGGAFFTATGTLFNNSGIIRADGAGLASTSQGAGAGGAIFINVTTVAGIGNYTVRGGVGGTGANDGAGGGGRISIWANNVASLAYSQFDVSGGTDPVGGIDDGGDGTLALIDKDDNAFYTYHQFRMQLNDFPTNRMQYSGIEFRTGIVLINGSVTMSADDLVVNGSTVLADGLEMNLTLNGSRIVVAAGSSVDATAAGYIAGPGAGTGDDGGAYGGDGGSVGGTRYGSAMLPLDYGSGAVGGRGGGHISITGVNLTVDGSILANGKDPAASVGGGAGGSIFVNVSKINGSGIFSAVGGSSTGGTNDGAGGGGRMALRADDLSSLTPDQCNVSGGTANPGNFPGEPGTIVWIDKDDSIFTTPNNFRFESGDFTNGTVTFSEYRALDAQVFIDGNWRFYTSDFVIENSNITRESGTVNISIASTRVNVSVNSRVDASTGGHLALQGLGGASGSEGGGAYGGDGGGPNGGNYYGSSLNPTQFGSGGGAGRGGGAIIIAATNVTIDGSVLADGQGATGNNGGGAGGTIAINTTRMSGQGVIRANGGNSGPSANDGAGGGGRIVVRAHNVNELDDQKFSVNPGTVFGLGAAGGGGTIVWIDTDDNDLYAVNNFRFQSNDLGNATTFNNIILVNATTLTNIPSITYTVNNWTMDSSSSLTGESMQNTNFSIIASDTILLSNVSVSVMRTQSNVARVHSGALLSTVSRGFAALAGPGQATNSEGGGAHGGDGGGFQGGNYYGSSLNPNTLGSGGGTGRGGGLIRIDATDLINNGTLDSSGGGATGNSGAGAAGTININVSSFSNGGILRANGGFSGPSPNDGAGGGGRIVVRAQNVEELQYQNFSARAGIVQVSGTPGQPGTIVWIDTDVNDLYAVNNFRFQSNDFGAVHAYSQIHFVNSTSLSNHPSLQFVVNNFTMDSASSLTGETFQGVNFSINASSNILLHNVSVSRFDVAGNIVTVTGTLSGAGRGYGPIAGPGKAGNTDDEGGAYGGDGGGFAGGAYYGSALNPDDMGSGGSDFAGGGFVGIRGGQLVHNGGIDVSGFGTATLSTGAGAGGGIFVNVTAISGTGTFLAKGGLGGAGGSDGGGGGGRIAVHATNVDTLTYSNFDVSPNGGTSPGQPGTIAWIDTNDNDLYAVNNFRFQQNDMNPQQTYRLLVFDHATTTSNVGSMTFNLSRLIMDQSSSFTPESVFGNNITIFASTNATVHNFSASKLYVQSPTVHVTGTVSTDGRGFPSGQGPGIPGGSSDDGAGHGGAGGGGASIGSEYGAAIRPVQFGSGNTFGGPAAAGGGLIIINATTVLVHNGTFSSQGEPPTAVSRGSSSGGSIYIRTPLYLGNGSFTARGGDTSGGGGDGAGGGGRISVWADNYETLNVSLFDVAGGTGPGPVAEAGSLVFVDKDLEIVYYPLVTTSRIEQEDLVNGSLNIGGFNLNANTLQLETDTQLNLSNVFIFTNSVLQDNGNAFGVRAPVINISGSAIPSTDTVIIYSDTFSDENVVYAASTLLELGKSNATIIQWNGTVTNIANLSQHVQIAQNEVNVNSTALPGLNSSAQITFYTGDNDFPLTLWDPQNDGTFEECPDTVCTLISFDPSSGIAIVNVSHFTGFSTGFNSNLTIYDSGDVEGGPQIINPTRLVTFVADYTNKTSGAYINGTCEIHIPVLNITTNMTFNLSGDDAYGYQTSFPVVGSFSWDVNCTNSFGFSNLTATDGLIVFPIVPEFSTIALLLALGLIMGGFVTIRRR